MDFNKIDQQIAEEKAKLDKQLADMIAEQNAKIEAQRSENERRRSEAEKIQQEKSLAQQRMRDAHKAAQEELDRAEAARKRAEETKLNIAAEAKLREEESAAALQKKISDLQFAHEQALKRLKDSFVIAAHEVGSVEDVLGEVKKDGSELKPVLANDTGSTNPLKHFVQADNN